MASTLSFGGGRGQRPTICTVFLKCSRAAPLPAPKPRIKKPVSASAGWFQEDRKQTLASFSAGAARPVPLVDVNLSCGASPALLEPLRSCLMWRLQLLTVPRCFGAGKDVDEDFLCSLPTPAGWPSPFTAPGKSTDLRTTVIWFSDATEESERRAVQTLLLILCRP